MTQYSSPKDYLKQLKIIHSYLKKFYYYSASEWLQPDVYLCIKAIETEIEKYENTIAEYKLKERLRQEHSQLTIQDIIRE